MKASVWAILAVTLLLAALMLPAGCTKAEPESRINPIPERVGDVPQPVAPAPAVGPEIAQKFCPVMGQPIDPDIYVDRDGRRVYFCCQACVATFKKDPETYLKKLDEQLKGAEVPAPE